MSDAPQGLNADTTVLDAPSIWRSEIAFGLGLVGDDRCASLSTTAAMPDRHYRTRPLREEAAQDLEAIDARAALHLAASRR